MFTLQNVAVEPLPMPPGMTKEALEAMRVTGGKWRLSSSFACRACHEPAYLHPYTNQIWGCKKCGTTTYSVSVFFEPALPSESRKRVGQPS